MIELSDFNPDTGQVLVSSPGLPTMALDVPIEDGKYLCGDALRTYAQGLMPTWVLARAESITVASNASDLQELYPARLVPAAPTPTYSDFRRAAYPPMTDYLDALVKGDSVAVEMYIEKCREVKARFPKPEPVSDTVLRERRDL